MIPKILLLVEQIRPTTTQIDNLRTAVPILLQACALEAVKCVGDALAAADDALVLVVAEGAFVANAGERRGPHVRVADRAFAVTFVTQPADGYSRLLSAHYEISVQVLLEDVRGVGGVGRGDACDLRMMARHVGLFAGEVLRGSDAAVRGIADCQVHSFCISFVEWRVSL
jgi:hypothetical protein